MKSAAVCCSTTNRVNDGVLRMWHKGVEHSPIIITIDGPGGSGKGTIARLTASSLGFHVLDSGALYRLTALAAQNRQVDLADSAAVAKIAETLDVEFVSGECQKSSKIILDGHEVTHALRTEQAGEAASKVAAIPLVRQALLKRQRDFAVAPGLVADGRDMGTVVFSEALLKIYLTASVQIRAERRYKELKEKGESVSLPQLFDEIKARDDRDMGRSVAPLKPADDAVIIDSSRLSIEEVLDLVLGEYHKAVSTKSL